LCWELGIQLGRDLKPQLDDAGAKLLLVSIGTEEKLAMFHEETKFPLDTLYADADSSCYQALGLYKSVRRAFFDPATPMSMLSRIQNEGMGDLADIMPRWKPWIPPKQDQAFQQGGMLVFQGEDAVFFHRDQATGDHANFEEVLRAALGGTSSTGSA